MDKEYGVRLIRISTPNGRYDQASVELESLASGNTQYPSQVDLNSYLEQSDNPQYPYVNFWGMRDFCSLWGLDSNYRVRITLTCEGKVYTKLVTVCW